MAEKPVGKHGVRAMLLHRGLMSRHYVDLATFIRICSLYSKEKERTKFRDFFFSIIDIFQLPKEQALKNMAGLMGELLVMKNIYEETGKSISYMWHKKSSDKYDFADGDKIIEVKTTLSNLLEIKIKHQQLFGRPGIVLGVVQLEKANAGISLKILIEEMKAIPVFRDDLQFNLILEKELRRVSKTEVRDIYFNCICIKYYKNTDLDTFDDIPSNITELSYSYYLGDVQSINVNSINVV